MAQPIDKKERNLSARLAVRWSAGPPPVTSSELDLLQTAFLSEIMAILKSEGSERAEIKKVIDNSRGMLPDTLYEEEE